MSVAVEGEGEEVEAGVKSIEISRCFFSLSPQFISPVPHFQIFVLNFTIHHDNFTVSAFVSNSAAVHRPHWPSIGFPFPRTS